MMPRANPRRDAGPEPGYPSAVARPRDIVLVMTDQQRHDQIGLASEGYFETPALDDLARRGVVFRNAISAAATCIPARIGLLTGLQARRVPRVLPNLALGEGAWTIAHALRSIGYETALIGKMHFTPMHADHGFDVIRTSEHLGASVLALRPDGSPDLDDYHQWLVDAGVAAWLPLEVGKAPKVEPIRPADAGRAQFPYHLRFHATTWIEHEVRAYLAQRRADRPMFLVISFPHPHPPLNPPEPYTSRYDEADAAVPRDGMAVNDRLPEPFRSALRGGTAQYGGWRVAEQGEARLRTRLTQVRALVRQIDDAIGRLLDGLAWDRTVVAFTSDHGDFAGHRGIAGKVPWIPFDDLVRVPLILAGAGIASGREITSTVQSCDLALTFCDLAGIAPPAAVDEFDSASLAPFLGPEATPGDPDRVALFLANPGWPGGRRGSRKLIWDPQSDARVLFDLDADPGETVDVSGDPTYGSDLDELDRAVRTAMAREPPQLCS